MEAALYCSHASAYSLVDMRHVLYTFAEVGVASNFTRAGQSLFFECSTITRDKLLLLLSWIMKASSAVIVPALNLSVHTIIFTARRRTDTVSSKQTSCAHATFVSFFQRTQRCAETSCATNPAAADAVSVHIIHACRKQRRPSLYRGRNGESAMLSSFFPLVARQHQDSRAE